MRFCFRGWWISLFICGWLICASCADEKEPEGGNDQSLTELLAQGKHELMVNDGYGAAETFGQAQALDKDSLDAGFGLFLAQLMEFPNFIDQIISTINGLSFAYSDPSDEPAADPIHDYLLEYIVGQIENNETLYAELADGPDFDFQLQSYDIQIDESPLLEFGGEFDQIDLQFFSALNALVDGLLNFILALDLRFDPTVLQFDLEADLGTFETIDMIVDLLDALLSSPSYPTFLALAEDGGVTYMQATGIDFGNAFIRLESAFDGLKLKHGSRSDHQFGYVDENGDGIYDPLTDQVFIGETVTLEPDQAIAIRNLCAKLAAAFYEGSLSDIDPHAVNLFWLSDLDELLTAFDILPIILGPLSITGLPGAIGINLGELFADPDPNGVRDVLWFIVELWKYPADLFPEN